MTEYKKRNVKYKNGKIRTIRYSSGTRFLVQVGDVGQGYGGLWGTLITFTGDLDKAFEFYERIKLNPQRKKRIYAPSFNVKMEVIIKEERKE